MTDKRELPYELDLNYDIKTIHQLKERIKYLPKHISNLQHELDYLQNWLKKLESKK